MAKSITAKDAWTSNAIEKLTNITASDEITESRTDMIHKLNMLDESLNVYNVRLDNVLNLGDKLVERIINVRKKRVNTNTTVNTFAKAEDLILETRRRVFYDDNLKKWNGKGDTILRNITCNYEGKIFFTSSIEQSSRMLFNNIEIADSLAEKLRDLNFKELHVCPSLIGSQTESVFEDDFVDEDLALAVNEEHFIDNFADQFNDFGIDDIEPQVHQEIKFEELEPTPFTYHKAWAGPSYWKLSSIRRRTKTRKENKKRKFDFFEFYDKSAIFSDRRNTLFKEEEILERRKMSKMLKKDFGIRVEDLYTYCLITTMDCFIEKKERIDEENNFSVNNTINDLSLPRNNTDHEININDSSIKGSKANESTNENIQIPEILGLKHPKAQRRINMRDLQEKIHFIINKARKNEKIDKGIPFKQIFEELKNEITWQYMVVAILEMANSGLKIAHVNSENVVY